MSEAEHNPPPFAPEADAPPPASPAPEPVPALPSRSERDLWLEVIAVLAVGVIPPFMDALAGLVHSWPPLPYWADAIHRCVISACTAFVVLYLIHRSGESWESFGITRPGFSDVCLGVVLFLAMQWFWYAVLVALPRDEERQASLFTPPVMAVDYFLMVLAQSANGFAEELVTRAYLITRLSRLLRSDLQAVLLSALLFASYHVYQGLDSARDIFLFGLIYGGFYLLVRRVWPFALAHALGNIYLGILAANP